MKYLSFKLSMPNNNSWNGKWSGENRQYYLIKKVSERFFKNDIEPMLHEIRSYYWRYNFGDGWAAGIELEIIDSKEARKRKKISAGFCGYEWMVHSIINYGEILNTAQIKRKKDD